MTKEILGALSKMDCFKPITINEQTELSNILKTVDPITSELTFPYLYMWRRDFNLGYTLAEDHLCMISQSRVYRPFAFCPIHVGGKKDSAKFKKALDIVEAYFNEKGFPLLFGRVEESRLDELSEVYGQRMEIEFLDSASDYVYESSSLINLSGKKLSSKRNHISQFIRNYGSYEYIPVNEENLAECRMVLNNWFDRYENSDTHTDNCERFAAYELLDNWNRFNMKGALIKVDGKYEAFTAGELLNPYTAAIRIEKGNSDIHGIYTIINRDFCAREWSGIKYINREEDLGIEGLRKSKLSYNPAFMVRKFLVKVLH